MNVDDPDKAERAKKSQFIERIFLRLVQLKYQGPDMEERMARLSKMTVEELEGTARVVQSATEPGKAMQAIVASFTRSEQLRREADDAHLDSSDNSVPAAWRCF